MTSKLYNWLTITNTSLIILLVAGLITSLVLIKENHTSLTIAIEKESMIRYETDQMIFKHIDQVKKSVNEITVKIKKIEEKLINKIKVKMPIPPKPRVCADMPPNDYHVVVKGDTLFKIAFDYCINLEELIDMNKELLTKNNMVIYPGDKIKLYWY